MRTLAGNLIVGVLPLSAPPRREGGLRAGEVMI